MDAQTFFREGVLALREKQDAALARQLLTQSLKLDPNNELAWLWLSRTTNDPQQKLQCVERALRINPNNEQALALRDKLRVPAAPTPTPTPAFAAPAPTYTPPPPAAPTYTPPPPAAPFYTPAPPDEVPPPGSLDDLRGAIDVRAEEDDHPFVSQQDINALLADAERLLQAGDAEGAIERWVRVLNVQVDHPIAIQNAVRQLFKLGYKDDAMEVLDRAIQARTPIISIYMTAIDLARARGEPNKADSLRETVALLPHADETVIIKMVDYFVEAKQNLRAAELLEKALELHPESELLLNRMGRLYEQTLHKKNESRRYYEQATRVKVAIKTGRTTEAVQVNFTPVMTDRERGSIPLAVREAVGFGVIYLLLGWQDAGLNLARMGAARWLGVGLAVFGGYLLVTALSAPQQKPLASWFGGKVPENPAPPKPKAAYEEETPTGLIEQPTSLPRMPPSVRAMFAVAGLFVLVVAFLLVFSVAIQLIAHPVPPTYLPTLNDLLKK